MFQNSYTASLTLSPYARPPHRPPTAAQCSRPTGRSSRTPTAPAPDESSETQYEKSREWLITFTQLQVYLDKRQPHPHLCVHARNAEVALLQGSLSLSHTHSSSLSLSPSPSLPPSLSLSLSLTHLCVHARNAEVALQGRAMPQQPLPAENHPKRPTRTASR